MWLLQFKLSCKIWNILDSPSLQNWQKWSKTELSHPRGWQANNKFCTTVGLTFWFIWQWTFTKEPDMKLNTEKFATPLANPGSIPILGWFSWPLFLQEVKRSRWPNQQTGTKWCPQISLKQRGLSVLLLTPINRVAGIFNSNVRIGGKLSEAYFT